MSSRELDALVAERVLGKRMARGGMAWVGEGPDPCAWPSWYGDDGNCVPCPRYSASLDAIWPVAVERGHDGPAGWDGCRFSISREWLKSKHDCMGYRVYLWSHGMARSEVHPNPATALCVALLRAHGVSEAEIEEAMR